MSAPGAPVDFAVPDDPDIEVWAGGGIVRDGDGRVLLVHRPRYDDWTLPKGKLDPGETLDQCALREVREETGLVCELGAPVAVSRYLDDRGRSKEVRYWEMRVTGGSFAPNDEVDRMLWLPPGEAVEVLSYARDRVLIDPGRAPRGPSAA